MKKDRASPSIIDIDNACPRGDGTNGYTINQLTNNIDMVQVSLSLSKKKKRENTTVVVSKQQMLSP